MKKEVCIIVPVKSAGNEFESHIRSLLEIEHPSYEIIVVDDGLKEIPPVLNEFKDKILLIKSGSKGPSCARNLGAKTANAQYLAFTDSDCIVAGNWLKELLRGFQKYPEAVACGGIQELPPDASFFERKVSKLFKKAGIIAEYTQNVGQIIAEVSHNASCNVIYKREVFLKEGGFLEGLWPGEDVELDYRLRKKGYAIVCNPEAIVYHYRPKNIKSFLRMMHRYGDVQGILVRKYGFFRKVQIVPLMSLALFIFLLYSMGEAWPLWGILGACMMTFFLLIYFSFDLIIFILAVLGFTFWHFGFLRGVIRSR